MTVGSETGYTQNLRWISLSLAQTGFLITGKSSVLFIWGTLSHKTQVTEIMINREKCRSCG